MTTMTITPFYNGPRAYSRAQPYKAPVTPSGRMTVLTQYLENLVVQARHHAGPTGVSFATWRGSSNTDANFVEAHALALDYQVAQFEALRDAADGLGWARVWFTGENKARTTNTITLVLPFAAPATKAQYERIASCVAKELDTYGLIDGALAVNHITNVHATTLTAYERGEVLDPQEYIRRTARLHQARDAKKYHAVRRPASAVRAQVDHPYVTSDDGLWSMPVRDADVIMLDAHRATPATLPDLTAHGAIVSE